MNIDKEKMLNSCVVDTMFCFQRVCSDFSNILIITYNGKHFFNILDLRQRMQRDIPFAKKKPRRKTFKKWELNWI